MSGGSERNKFVQRFKKKVGAGTDPRRGREDEKEIPADGLGVSVVSRGCCAIERFKNAGNTS
jgi:hypothetical protein